MPSNKPDEIFFDPAIYESQFAYAAQFADVPFWIQLAKTFGPKVLELACGTGRVTIPAFESGVDIDGLDFSESMLKVARERAKARFLTINFFGGDIRSLSLRQHTTSCFSLQAPSHIWSADQRSKPFLPVCTRHFAQPACWR
jgi:SAM-dependent methyltransferase